MMSGVGRDRETTRGEGGRLGAVRASLWLVIRGSGFRCNHCIRCTRAESLHHEVDEVGGGALCNETQLVA